jgi:xylulokinase
MKSCFTKQTFSASDCNQSGDDLKFAVGADSGTQGIKVVVIDLDGRVIARGYAPHRLVDDLKPGESEQDPRIWVDALEKALAQAFREGHIDPSQVRSLGISGQQHGFVPLDVGGNPIRPAKLWNDTSTIAETEWLVAEMGGKKELIGKLGIALAVGFTASKILWLQRHEPKNYDRLRSVLLPHNYLNFHLTGNKHMEFGDGSGTGLMDIRRQIWSAEMIGKIDPHLMEKLPPLSHPREPAGVLRPELAKRFGMGEVLIASGGGDNMMAAIGTGNVRPGIMTLSLGTSGTIYSCFDRPFIDPEGEIAAFCDSTGGWLPLLCTMNVTNTTEIFKEMMGFSNKELENLASESAPGAGGLIFLPYVDGERVPELPFASAVFFGLNRRTFSASHMARSVMEGTIFNLGYGFSRLRSLGLHPQEVRVTGGGAKNRLWLQIVADIFQVPVRTLCEEEAGAYGAALQSIWNDRMYQKEEIDIADITGRCVRLETEIIVPNPGNSGYYQELQEQFNELSRGLKKNFLAHRNLGIPKGNGDPAERNVANSD